VAAACVTIALLLPADAQFWGPWGGGSWERRQQPQPQRPPQNYNPFGGWFGGSHQQREAPADYSRAPATQRKTETAVTTPIVVVGDSMADWLAYGLEDAFSEKPEFSIVRKNRTYSGLIRYDPRRDSDWVPAIKETLTADKPKFIVMMIGVNDRQAIRERAPVSAPTPARPNAAAGKLGAGQPALPLDPELQAQRSADQQNAELQEKQEEPPEPPVPAAPEHGRGVNANTGPFEFHTEKWEAAYIRRIDAAIAAMKGAGVPVFWVGLPPQRVARASTDSAYLNELYRQRAEKAGVIYVDVWDGFVDSSGQFAAQGPDFEGQIRRLRSGDGIYFTKPGARKLAHYVEREIQRTIANRALPVALPAPEPTPATPGARPGGPAQRPLVGPVVPLTILTAGQNDLLGASPTRPAADPVATRVLTKGETIPAASGRADDFSWPRNSTVVADPPPPAVLPEPAQAKGPAAGSKAGTAKQPQVQKRTNPAGVDRNVPRPPGAIKPSASANQGTVR